MKEAAGDGWRVMGLSRKRQSTIAYCLLPTAPLTADG
jgi:hypothetical protein